MRRPPSGVALAWMFLVAFVPVGGFFFYLLIGERRVGLRRARRIAAIRSDYAKLARQVIHEGLTQVPWDKHRPEARGMDRLGTCLVGIPTVAGSMAQFYSESEQTLRTIVEDIESARKSVLMEFYIWSEGGSADDVLEALIRAARAGSRLPRADQRGRGHGSGGGAAAPAAPRGGRAGPARLARQPAASHRVAQRSPSAPQDRGDRRPCCLDGQHEHGRSPLFQAGAPTSVNGSMPWSAWKDRSSAPLALTMIGDWILETAESIDPIIASAEPGPVGSKGTEDMQVIPSGPGEGGDGLLQMLLAVINSAREELVLTTPYLVPDDSMLRALRGAAGRGVRVDMILPERVDSL